MIIFLVGATSTPYLNNMSPRTNDSLLRKGVAPLVGADELIIGGWLKMKGQGTLLGLKVKEGAVLGLAVFFAFLPVLFVVLY